MTTAESDFLSELEESAQGHDLFRAPGSDELMAQARDQAEAAGWVPPHVAENWPIDDERTAIAIRRQRLYDAMKGLETAAARATRQPDWLAQVTDATDDLREALRDHREQTEGDQGFLEDLVRQAPRLAADAGLLKEEHRTLVNDCARLTSLIRSNPEDVEAIRRSVIILLGRIVEHRQRGAELLYDAYNVEFGDGD